MRELCAPGIPPRTAERAGQRIPRTESSSALKSWFVFRAAAVSRLPPKRAIALELDLALGRLYVLEESVDDCVDGNSLRFCGEVREHAMSQHRSRDTGDVRRRNGESAGEKRMRFCAENQGLPCTRTCSPSHVLLHVFRCFAFVGARCASELCRKSQCRI